MHFCTVTRQIFNGKPISKRDILRPMQEFQVSSLTPHMGLSISGLDISAGLEQPTIDKLAGLIMDHKVLLFRDQTLTPEQYAKFGRSWCAKTRVDSFHEMHVPGFDDMNQVGNVGDLFEDEGYRNGAAFWHTDCAAEPDPNALTMLYSIHAPSTGGETVIADMEQAYQALDSETRQEIGDLHAWHAYSGAKPVLGGREEWEFPLTPVTENTANHFPDPVLRPLVRTHSVTARKSLYSPGGSAFAIEGMDNESAGTLMRDLKLHATQEQFCYRHQWRIGDLLMWDNSSTMHYASPTEAARSAADRRLMYRMCPLGLPSALT